MHGLAAYQLTHLSGSYKPHMHVPLTAKQYVKYRDILHRLTL